MQRRDVLAGMGAGVLVSAAGGALAGPLDGYLWKRRLLLVFAPVKPYPTFMVQRDNLKPVTEGLEERDITVIEIVHNSVFIKGHPKIEMNAKQLRADHGVEIVEFKLLLIGKDGEEKMRRGEAMEAEDLFAMIDAMPLRKQEMRQRGQG